MALSPWSRVRSLALPRHSHRSGSSNGATWTAPRHAPVAETTERLHRTRVSQRGDLLPCVTEFEQHRLRMLPVLGRLLRLGGDFAVERNRASAHTEFSRHRMVETHDVTVHARLLAGEHLLISQHLGRQDVRRRNLLEPFARALLRKDPIKYRFNFAAVEIARRIVGAFRILLDRLDSNDPSDVGPTLVVDTCGTYVSLAGSNRAPHA